MGDEFREGGVVRGDAAGGQEFNDMDGKVQRSIQRAFTGPLLSSAARVRRVVGGSANRKTVRQ